jgi:hypothetical protein
MTMPDEDRRPGDHLTPDERDPEAPAEDAIEQATTTTPDRDLDVSRDPEVNEWDAVEQARVVEVEDDYR